MNTDRSVRLGLLSPLSGIVGIYGTEISNAGRIACQEVNAAGGVLGRPLQLIIEDDGSLPITAVPAAKRLIDEHQCVALIGNLLSNSRIAVAYRVAEPRKVPYLNFSFYEGSILSRYFFHFAALPNQQIDLMIPYMQRHYGDKMFFAGNNYEWPRGSIDAAKKALDKNHGVVVGERYLPIGANIEQIEDLLNELAASEAQVFVPYFAGEDQIKLLTQFTRRGLKSKMAVVMGHFDEAMVGLLPTDVRSGLFSVNTYFMSVPTTENRNYLEHLKKLSSINGLWPKGNGVLTNFGEGTFLCVKAFAEAANRAGSLESEALVRALEHIQLKGPQGPVEMDPQTHHAKVNAFLSRCDADGTFSIIESFGAIAPVIPERYQHLQITEHQGSDDIRTLARMMEQMNEGAILISCHDGKIVYSNSGFQKMFGFSSDELKGRIAAEFYSSTMEGVASIRQREIDRILYQKGLWKGEIKGHRKTGVPLWCAISISAFTHAEFGEAWMAIYRDITEEVEKDEQLIHAKKAAEAANQAKSLFLAAMSHEMRTPLNAILGMAELLDETPLSEDQKKYITLFKEAGSSLLALVNDILDISKVEYQKGVLEHLPFDLETTTQSCIDMLKSKAMKKGLVLRFTSPSLKIPKLLGDPLRLRQVLINLIGNAIKFTNHGFIGVEIQDPKVLENDQLEISILVRDTGVGIPSSEHQRIFQLFTQVDAGYSRKFGGAGLGLAISKSFIETMGGQIKVMSEPQKGSVFCVTVPWSMVKEQEQDQARGLILLDATYQDPNIMATESIGVSKQHQRRPWKLLMVDDSEENLFLLSAFLKKQPYQIETAQNGNEAIEKVKKTTYDVILMDIQMPIKDGYSAIQEIRQWEKENGLIPAKIIAVTANAMPEDRLRCLEAGATDYLAKPIRKNELIFMIERGSMADQEQPA